MSWLSSFLHPERGYDAAQNQLNNYYGQAQGYQQPYAQNGQSAYGGLNTAMGRLLDPAGLQNEWAQGYEMSPQAKQAQELAKQSGLDAMSAQGVMGSTPALNAMQAGETQISLNDRQNYLNDLMNKYQAGIGLGQNIYGTGANAAGQMGRNAINMGENSAQMAYNRTNAQGSLLGNLMGGAASIGASALGGPIGYGLANKMGLPMQGWSTYGGR